MKLFRRLALGLLLARCASGEVIRVEVTEESEVAGLASAAGAYTRIVGKVYFAVDPRLAVNRAISDIDLAPRNAQGRVEFSADFYLLQPKSPARGNGTVLFEVPNRGRKSILTHFNLGTASYHPRTAPEYGDGFLFDRGYTLAWLGWQWDVPAEDNLLRFNVPRAVDGAKPMTGLVRADFVPDERVTSIRVADRTHTAYPVDSPDDLGLQLTERDRRDGPRRVVPRDQWRLDESRTTILKPGGFEPGRVYELVYPSRDPALVGLGLAAIRDYISYLKQHRATNGVRQALAYGSSQSGRLLRTFLYYGFNEDESGQRVFDGIWANVGGAGRGSFNHRFAQPSRDARAYFNFFYPTDLFPFSDAPQTDPITGLTEGLLDRTRKAGVEPRIFYTNGAYEYYGRAASLVHTTVDGTRDLALDANTRLYFVPGSQHGEAIAFPPQRAGTQNLANANDYRWSARALLAGLQRWVEDGTEPPASTYPKIARGELAPLAGVRFPRIPGVKFPERIHDVFALDYGPDFRRTGIVTIEPPKVGPRYPVLLPQVDADGNEIAGLRMPLIQVPLATYTGWNLRAPEVGAPEETFSFAGSTIPFARTRAEREKSGDPRPAIAERYQNRADYLDKVRTAISSLVEGRYLLESDTAAMVAQAGQYWDYWTR